MVFHFESVGRQLAEQNDRSFPQIGQYREQATRFGQSIIVTRFGIPADLVQQRRMF